MARRGFLNCYCYQEFVGNLMFNLTIFTPKNAGSYGPILYHCKKITDLSRKDESG